MGSSLITYIIWEDAMYNEGYASADDALKDPPYIMHSTGHLITEDSRFVVIGSDYNPGQKNYRHITWVPKRMITARIDKKVTIRGKSKPSNQKGKTKGR